MSFAALNTAHRNLHSHFMAQALKNPAAVYVASLHFAKTRMSHANAPHIHLTIHDASQARTAALGMLRGTPAQRALLVRQAKILLQVLKIMQDLQRPSPSASQGTNESSPKASAYASGNSSRSTARSASKEQSRPKTASSSGSHTHTQRQHTQKPQQRPNDAPRYSQSKPAGSDEAAPAQPDSNPIADPFKVLGVKAGASPAEIKKAYIKAARENHPDKGGSAEKMQEINKAYAQITDQARKVNK